MEPKDLVQELLTDGYDLQQISDFLCDGSALLGKGITDQCLVDQAYLLVQEMMKGT